MPKLRFLTAGESHGPELTVILEGIPAGLELSAQEINNELALRQKGFGRSGRQKLEQDQVRIHAGLRHGITTGAPLALTIINKDFLNWQNVMATETPDLANAQVQAEMAKKAITCFRPGHADFAGTVKFAHQDIRNVLERASARETAARVAAGAVAKKLLASLGITITSFVEAIGSQSLDTSTLLNLPLSQLEEKALASEVFCPDQTLSAAMIEEIKEAMQEGDSLGGKVVVACDNLPVGLGSYCQWDKRLDGLLAQALMSIPAVKAMEIGLGVSSAQLKGSQVHDALYPKAQENSPLPVSRQTNHAGGLEGGMTNGERLFASAFMKPIPTLRKGLPSVSFPDFQSDIAHFERSDNCAVPALAIVARAMVSLTLAGAIIDKFGGDNFQALKDNLERYRLYCSELA
jgi:chorismate synthase